MAQGALRKASTEAGLEFEIDSAGTHEYMPGKPPYPLAVAVAKRHGCDITQIVARRIRPLDFRYFDLILAMDEDNLACLRREAPRHYRRKIHLLLEYGSKYRGRAVPDPYSAGISAFELAFDMIEDGCQGLVRSYLRSRTKARIGAHEMPA